MKIELKRKELERLYVALCGMDLDAMNLLTEIYVSEETRKATEKALKADIQSLESLRNDAYYEFDVRDKIKIQEAIQKQLNKTMKVLEEGERFKL